MNLHTALLAKQAKTAESRGVAFRPSTVTDMVMHDISRRKTVSYKHSAAEYDAATNELNDATNRIEAAIDRLVQAEKNTSEKAKSAVGRAKDTAAQLGDALNRVNRLLGQDFETRLAQVERMAEALSKLAELERTGRLQGVMKALSNP